MDTLPAQEQSFLLDTDWEGYLKICEVVGERPIKITYDRGLLELMTNSYEHESMKTILSTMFEALLVEREIDYLGGGQMTFRRQDLDRGLEPDECYWISHWKAMRGVREFDSLVHPPPDLVLEIDVTRSSINRIKMLAAMGVPEVWRYQLKGALEVRVLEAPGEYKLVEESQVVPGFAPACLLSFLTEHPDLSISGLVRAFRRSL